MNFIVHLENLKLHERSQTQKDKYYMIPFTAASFPQSQVCFLWFQLPVAPCGLEAGDPPPPIPSEGQGSLTLSHHARVTHLTPPHHAGMLPSHSIPGRRVSSVESQSSRESETTFGGLFITACCYTCLILLPVIVVNLLLCLIYKSNVITGYVYTEKKTRIYRVYYYL